MPSEQLSFVLYTIRDNIQLAQQFVDGLTRESFERSPLHFYAVTRALEIISEASRRLPEDVRERHSHLPWRAIRDVGNFYRHEYDNVLEAYVWETVQTRLEPLKAAIDHEISELYRGR
jgi:uncharacterized protein with HEPN domain